MLLFKKGRAWFCVGMAAGLGACASSPEGSELTDTQTEAAGVVVSSSGTCTVELTKINYDQPGNDTEDFIELKVSRNGGTVNTLLDCTLNTLVVYKEGSCLLPHSLVVVGPVLVPENGRVVIGPSTAGVSITGTSPTEHWLPNGHAELGFLSVAVLNLPLLWASWEGAATCTPLGMEVPTVAVQTEGNSAPDMTNVWCNNAFSLVNSAVAGPGVDYVCPGIASGTGGTGAAGGSGGATASGGSGAAVGSGGSGAGGGSGGSINGVGGTLSAGGASSVGGSAGRAGSGSGASANGGSSGSSAATGGTAGANEGGAAGEAGNETGGSAGSTASGGSSARGGSSAHGGSDPGQAGEGPNPSVGGTGAYAGSGSGASNGRAGDGSGARANVANQLQEIEGGGCGCRTAGGSGAASAWDYQLALLVAAGWLRRVLKRSKREEVAKRSSFLAW